ncbi:MAG: IclR family transcriptional regulator [Solirubrobacteraceae bacterium]|nr:IclR family transcriptional regulator [Solirubrobacteraceae bacterium]
MPNLFPDSTSQPDGKSTALRPVAAVARAATLLDLLAAAPDGLGTNELARQLGVNPSNASRLLGTLRAAGLVDRAVGDGPWRLGLHLVALADHALAALDVRELARPAMRQLAAETGETVTLSVSVGAESVTVEFVPGAGSVVSVAQLGRSSVAHATATGKVMLAFGDAPLPEGELAVFTERTITQRKALAGEVKSARSRGYAEAVGEREEDLVALAVPIVGAGSRLIAILGLQGPESRLTEKRRAAVVPALLEAAADVATALGGAPR